jgi:hypothetical protein
MKSLQELVVDNPGVFRGAVRESERALSELESRLEVSLPADVKWFWLNCGDGGSGAAPSAETSVTDTLRYREAVALPHKYVVLEDRNDAGTVFLDTTTGAVAWVDSHATAGFADGSALATEYDCFPSFAAWVEDCIEQNRD